MHLAWNATLRLTALLLGAAAILATPACTWTTSCTGYQDRPDECSESLVAADHPTARGAAARTCSEAQVEPRMYTPEFAGIAECTLEDDELTLHVGSGACDNVTLRLSDFRGPGRYALEERADGYAPLSMHLFVPGTGCQKSGAAFFKPREACAVEPPACEVVIGGDFSLERGGDIEMSIECDTLSYTGIGQDSCGTCAPSQPIEVSFRDCAW